MPEEWNPGGLKKKIISSKPNMGEKRDPNMKFSARYRNGEDRYNGARRLS
jgi:hypothetical protein